VNVLEDEHAKERAKQDKADGKITMDDLAKEIRSLKALIEEERKK
jgi:voltage-gated sodium channel